MAVMGSPHGSDVWQNKLTMFGAHCPFNPLVQLAESKVSIITARSIPLSSGGLYVCLSSMFYWVCERDNSLVKL